MTVTFRRLVLPVCLAVLLAGNPGNQAWAQGGEPVPLPVENLPLSEDDHGEGAAYAWLLAGTLATTASGFYLAFAQKPDLGLFLMGVGTIAAPSFGQVYAGSPLQGAAGLAVRALGVVLFVPRFSEEWDASSCRRREEIDSEGPCPEPKGLGSLPGFLVWTGGFVYSLVDTHYAVKRKVKRARAAGFGLSPTLEPAPGGLRTGAMAFIRF